MGDEFLASLQQLAAKLEFIEGDETAKYTAAYRWGVCMHTGVGVSAAGKSVTAGASLRQITREVWSKGALAAQRAQCCV